MGSRESGTYDVARIAFGRFVLIPSRRELFRDGLPLHLEPKAFAVLLTLVTERHRVVPHEELLERHWPGEVVCRGAITQCLWTVRRALGDQAGARQVIRTVHRIGYQFVGDVEEEVDGAASSAGSAS